MAKLNKLSSQSPFWQKAKTPILVAHRGGNGAGIEKENSLKAFQVAYGLGYRWFETDVVPTKDGVLLAIHGRGYQLRPNKDLPRRLKIQQMTYAAAKESLIVDGEPPIILDQLLELFPDVKVFIDPKTYKAVPALIKTLSERPQDINRVCIGAFSTRRTKAVYRGLEKVTGKRVCTSLLGRTSSWLVYQAATWSLLKRLATYYAQARSVESIHVPYRWVLHPTKGKKFITFTHSLGLKVAVYVPNDEQSIKKCLSVGADAIMSDNIELLKVCSKL